MGRRDDPGNDRKRRGHAADKRQASGYLAQLAWLELIDGTWTRFDNGRPLDVDGALIARTRRLARTVMREHPAALARLVGDVDRWWAIVDAKLAACTAWVAGKPASFDPLPWLPPRVQRTIVELARTPVGVAATRSAIAFVLEPDVVEKLIDWLAAHRAHALPVADVDRMWVWLARLVVRGDGGRAAEIRAHAIELVIALLELDAPDPMPALDASRLVESKLRGNKPIDAQAPAVPRSRPRIEVFLAALVVRSNSNVQHQLALLAEAGVAEAIAPWQAWEREHAPLLVRATELAANKFEAWNKAAHGVRLIAKLEKMRAAAPVPVTVKDVVVELALLAQEPADRFRPSLLRVLRGLPAALGPAARTRWLLHAARTAPTCEPEERIDWTWDALADQLEESAPLVMLSPWQAVFQGDGRVYAESELVEGATRRGDAQRAVRVLVELAWRGDLVKDDCARIAAWLEAGLTDEPLIAEVVRGLREADGYFVVPSARIAVALAETTTAAEMIAIGKALLAMTTEWRYDATRHLAELAEHAKRTGGAWIVRAAVLANQRDRLTELAETLALIPRAKWPPLTQVPGKLPWLARYPEGLHPALRRLAAVEPDAERAAANRLADDIPDPAALEREIAALRERTAKPGVAKRLANLEARLRSPKPPTPARLANLAGKLERAACELGLVRFARTIVDGARRRLIRALALPELPAWADSPRVATLLVALLDLDQADRELAARLVRARCGPPPWDLRDDPVNQKFLAQLRAARIDPEPWLSDAPRTVTPANGDPFTLALESDPIEVFAMGAHFQTCLSPNGGNFFSVVANAADINKRVIYARRDGKVIGRCLLALTEGFAILAFQIYSHWGDALHEPVREFVLDLAKRMGTSVVPRGSVRRLLARDWYDDGPRDLVGRFRGLDDAGLDLETIDPADLVGVLRAALDRDLDDVTLPLVLGYRGITNRPELIVPLAPYVLKSEVSLTRITAAEIALRAGDRGLADRLLGDHGNTIRLDDHVYHWGSLLAELRPSYTLARLRETRRRHVRSWADEPGDRAAIAGVALEALHRPKQAAEMYRLAMKYEDWLAPMMRVRLEALGETVE